MPLPLIPFVLGAAAGAVVTYFVTEKRSKRSDEAAGALPESVGPDDEEPRPKTGRSRKTSKDK